MITGNNEIKEYHAHIYFDESTVASATELRNNISQVFDLVVGDMRHKPVGPHLNPMFRVLFSSNLFSEVVQWLNFYRNGHSVLVHPVTGDSYLDHVVYAIWLGKQLPLDETKMDYENMRAKLVSMSIMMD